MKKQLLSIAFFSMVLLLSACGSNRIKLADSELSDDSVASSESAPAESAGEETSAVSKETASAVEAMAAAGEPAQELDAAQLAELEAAPEGGEATQAEVAQNDPTSGITMEASEPALAAPQFVAQADLPSTSNQSAAPASKPKHRRVTNSTTSSEVKSEPVTSAPTEAAKVEEPTAKTEEAPKVEGQVAANTATTAKTDEVDHFAAAPAANPVEQPEVQTASAGVEGILEKHPFAIALILVGAIGFIFVIARMRRGMEV